MKGKVVQESLFAYKNSNSSDSATDKGEKSSHPYYSLVTVSELEGLPKLTSIMLPQVFSVMSSILQSVVIIPEGDLLQLCAADKVLVLLAHL
jgi:hypothetical protein